MSLMMIKDVHKQDLLIFLVFFFLSHFALICQLRLGCERHKKKNTLNRTFLTIRKWFVTIDVICVLGHHPNPFFFILLNIWRSAFLVFLRCWWLNPSDIIFDGPMKKRTNWSLFEELPSFFLFIDETRRPRTRRTRWEKKIEVLVQWIDINQNKSSISSADRVETRQRNNFHLV